MHCSSSYNSVSMMTFVVDTLHEATFPTYCIKIVCNDQTGWPNELSIHPLVFGDHGIQTSLLRTLVESNQ